MRRECRDADPKRKAFEQAVVQWVRDEDMRLCISCGGAFNLLLKRRHHCRLCGSVICAKCSHFLTFSFGRK